MKLFIMRHGQAQGVAATDHARRLTATGAEETKVVASWLARLNPDFDITFVSPYNRTLDTYQCIEQFISPPATHLVLDELTPESDPASTGDSLLAYCAQQKAESALVISHLPLVGLLISDLCPGVVLSAFAPSSIACLDIDLANWSGQLLWLKSYDELRQGG